MEPINGFFSSLYSKFVLRDLLGRVFPGLIIILGLANEHEAGIWGIQSLSNISLLGGFILFSSSFVIGIILQSVRTIPYNLIEYFIWPKKKPLQALKDLKNNQFVRDQRERLVVLRDVTGNTSLAIFAVLTLTLWRNLSLLWLVVGLLAISSYHWYEVKIWEAYNYGTILARIEWQRVMAL